MTSSTWYGNSAFSSPHNYQTAANWNNFIVPTETASFYGSNYTSIAITGAVTAGAWYFGGPSLFQFTNTRALTFNGAGITGVAFTAVVIQNWDSVNFTNSSSAGYSAITNAAHTSLYFYNSSDAGHATINNSAAVEFNHTSNAGSAHFINNVGSSLYFYDTTRAASAVIDNQGYVNFFGTSSADNATITNSNSLGFHNGATTGYSSIVNDSTGIARFWDASSANWASISGTGDIEFHNTSTAAHSAITVTGIPDLNSFGSLAFFDTSSAGQSLITNTSDVTFWDSTTVGQATIANGDNAGLTFREFSRAGASTITNTVLGEIEFINNSTADHAMITNKGNMQFTGSSTAGNATISSDYFLNFGDAGSAGDATITNAYYLNFIGSSSAANAKITNSGIATFGYDSSAASATITNNGGGLAFSDYGTAANAVISNSGLVTFTGTSTAASSKITNSKTMEFMGSATAGNAQLINNAAIAVVEFSLSDGPNADHRISAGSIAGAGNFMLGSNQLTVGSNNLSTIVSGSIRDGGYEGSGASLVKIGAGTLTLSGTNTYTGSTVVNGGTLRLDGSTASAVTINSGGVLGGSGTVGGAVVVNAGGTLAPGASAGRLDTRSVNFQAGAKLAIELGGTAPDTGYDQIGVAGTVSLGAPTLDLRLINGFAPSLTTRQSFVLIDNDGTDAVIGNFAGLVQGGTLLSDGRFFTISYVSGTGNDVVITSAGANRIGTERNDVLGATAFFDTLDGRGGLDVADYSFMTSALKVTLKTGTQTIAGDTLISIEGLFGGSKADEFTGTSKANLFRGGGGKDKLDGKGGSDTADYGDKTKSVQVKLDSANAVTVKVNGKAEDTLKNIENVTGGSKVDKLSGDSKANTFDGRLGKDILTGDGGRDKFVFSTALATSNVDTITDFKHGTDKIGLDDAIFAIGSKLDTAEFYAKDGATKAYDASDRLVYDSKSGKLYYDDDGKGGHAAIQFATLSGHPAITYGDFAIV